MNRREKWDRVFKRKIQTTTAVKSNSDNGHAEMEQLEVEKQEEDKRRLEWDAQQAKIAVI